MSKKIFAVAFAIVGSEHSSIVNKEKRSPWGARKMAKFTYLKMTGPDADVFPFVLTEGVTTLPSHHEVRSEPLC